jgi:DNA invertase Pin-like site-specific DNA recombinase
VFFDDLARWFMVANPDEERDCIRECVKAGLRNARAKGKILVRPRASVDAKMMGRLRTNGRSVREIASELGYSRGLVHKTLANGRR